MQDLLLEQNDKLQKILQSKNPLFDSSENEIPFSYFVKQEEAIFDEEKDWYYSDENDSIL